jgi:hypothetical protein
MITKPSETKSCGNDRCQCEKDSGYSLLIVRIHNPSRLNADLTDDYLLVPNEKYVKAVAALAEEECVDSELLYSIKGVKDILTHNEIPFDHVINGHKFFFNIMMSEGCECNE